ncbi:MAG TPA: hypothetical protein DCM86_19760 [Verrucomicrobiales bacterium]|nr:hypothetical protein [Verrucomicrobiales bacterium]
MMVLAPRVHPVPARVARWACAVLLFLGSVLPSQAAVAAILPPRIVKVLPHWLDREGRHTLAPSLLERDAYQAVLRKDPSRRGGLRFDVQCRALPSDPQLTLRIEARGTRDRKATLLKTEKTFGPRERSRSWQPVTLSPEQFNTLGDLVAWRATLWSGDKMLAEEKSFLW